MKLTGRQEAFLGGFLDLYSQAQKPLHYTQVAEVLGVGKITAYDMLRLLEKRGLVRSEYVLRGEGQGGGRSRVVVVPTSQARALIAELGGEDWDQVKWETVKAQILDALRRRTDYQNLLDEILAVILNLLLVEERAPASALVERLKALGLPGEVGLNALSGLAMGLSLVDRANRRLTDKLVDAVRGYQQSLGRLRGEGRRHLSSFVQEAMRAVTAHKE